MACQNRSLKSVLEPRNPLPPNRIKTCFFGFSKRVIKGWSGISQTCSLENVFEIAIFFFKLFVFWCFKTDINHLFLNSQKIPLEEQSKIMWEALIGVSTQVIRGCFGTHKPIPTKSYQNMLFWRFKTGHQMLFWILPQMRNCYKIHCLLLLLLMLLLLLLVAGSHGLKDKSARVTQCRSKQAS